MLFSKNGLFHTHSLNDLPNIEPFEKDVFFPFTKDIIALIFIHSSIIESRQLNVNHSSNDGGDGAMSLFLLQVSAQLIEDR